MYKYAYKYGYVEGEYMDSCPNQLAHRPVKNRNYIKVPRPCASRSHRRSCCRVVGLVITSARAQQQLGLSGRNLAHEGKGKKNK